MKPVHLLAATLLALLLILSFTACACAAEIRPFPVDHDKVDLDNGEFRLSVRSTDLSATGSFIATLYQEDRYDTAQVEALVPGDIVWMNDLPWTVKTVQIHTTDSQEPAVSAYEIFPEEEFEGYLVFEPCADGTCRAVINDWYTVTMLGSVKVALPLPDRFRYVPVSSGEEEEPVTADEFLSFQEDMEDNYISFSPYSTTCVFENGELVRITDASYPWGPKDEFDNFPTAVWKFCHGLRDGLDTAVITAYTTDCETGASPAEITPEEAEQIRRLAMNGWITEKASDEMVTGNTWIYSFETPGGKHLLSIEMYKGHIVGSDGMYNYQ